MFFFFGYLLDDVADSDWDGVVDEFAVADELLVCFVFVAVELHGVVGVCGELFHVFELETDARSVWDGDV